MAAPVAPSAQIYVGYERYPAHSFANQPAPASTMSVLGKWALVQVAGNKVAGPVSDVSYLTLNYAASVWPRAHRKPSCAVPSASTTQRHPTAPRTQSPASLPISSSLSMSVALLALATLRLGLPALVGISKAAMSVVGTQASECLSSLLTSLARLCFSLRMTTAP